MTIEKLKGGQQSFFEERAFSVTCEGQKLTLCVMHLDLYRIIMEPRHVKYTGEVFPETDCEHCRELLGNNRNKVVAEV